MDKLIFELKRSKQDHENRMKLTSNLSRLIDEAIIEMEKSLSEIREVDRLAEFLLSKSPHEIGRGDFVNGESAVDVAIRLLNEQSEREAIK